MAKVKNIKAIQNNIERRIKEFKKDTKELERSARIIRTEIVRDTRAGKGFDGKSFPDLSEKTTTRRGRLATQNRTHKDYRQFFSNATFTGDTVRKIKSKVKSFKIEIGGQGKHKKIKGIRGKTIKGSDSDISDILSGLSKRGWKILGVSEGAKTKIKKQFLQFLRRKRK